MTDPQITPLDFEGWTCPLPLRDYPTIVMGHGSGGKLMADLIEHLFAPQFANDLLDQMGDATTLKFEISNLKSAIETTAENEPQVRAGEPSRNARNIRLREG